MFPVQIIKKSTRSRGKEHHLVMIGADGGERILVIFRFGMQKTWGPGWKVDKFTTPNGALAHWEKTFQSEMAGKEVILDTNITVKDQKELEDALGAYWMKLKATEKSWLHGAAPPAPVVQAPPFVTNDPLPVQEEPSKLTEIAIRVRENSAYGSF